MKGKRRLIWALLLAIPVAYAQPPSPTSVRDWIAEHAVRLSTPEVGHGFSDLQPLKRMVGEARIVSLGEATHGTREFFQLKHRILEFLATEMGFKIFAMEAHMATASRINEYVLTGNGDPAELVRVFGFPWDTEEVLDMIRWMREFNKSGKGPLQFTGFDMQGTKPAGEIVKSFMDKFDPGQHVTVQTAIAEAQNAGFAGPPSGVMVGSFPVADAAGRAVKFSSYIKTEGVTEYAGLWWRDDGPSGALNFANLGMQAPKGTTGWKQYELEISVPKEATNINFGVMLAGAGAIWFDELSIQVDGQRFETNEVFQFLENPAPIQGYEVRHDREGRREGKSALRIRRMLNTSNGDAVAAGAAWARILDHLEASRSVYLKRQSSAAEIDWAIQNARIVRQSMQMRANEVSRDQSMAANVSWILDHNPGAKIVLWAHNGHVATFGSGRWQTMGAALRQIYGDQMVVFGFAFHQGSFRAIEPGKLLRDFTVPPAPTASFDTMLGSVGSPLFALDLRRVPTMGPVADWFKRQQKTRNIGAQFSEATASNYMVDMVARARFDVMFFVEKTTPSHKNPLAVPR